MRAFDWCQNQRPWMTLKGHYALWFKTRASFGAHHEKLNKDRLYYTYHYWLSILVLYMQLICCWLVRTNSDEQKKKYTNYWWFRLPFRLRYPYCQTYTTLMFTAACMYCFSVYSSRDWDWM